MNIVNILCFVGEIDFEVHMYLVVCCPVTIICSVLDNCSSYWDITFLEEEECST